MIAHRQHFIKTRPDRHDHTSPTYGVDIHVEYDGIHLWSGCGRGLRPSARAGPRKRTTETDSFGCYDAPKAPIVFVGRL